jgi:hypothetical protein
MMFMKLWQDLSIGTFDFALMTLTLEFDLFLRNFNIGHFLWILINRIFIFHLWISFDNTSVLVPSFLAFHIPHVGPFSLYLKIHDPVTLTVVCILKWAFYLTWAESSSELFWLLIVCCPLFDVRLSVSSSLNFYIFDFSRTTGPILTRLSTNHPWGRGFRSDQMKGIALLQGEIVAKE